MASNKIRTAQAGLAYVTWQLARRDWAVLPASGTKKAATLIQIKKADYHPPLLVQSRAFSGQNAVSLGENITGPDQLPFDWMAITINVRSDTPACFLLNRQDVIERMKKTLMDCFIGRHEGRMQPVREQARIPTLDGRC